MAESIGLRHRLRALLRRRQLKQDLDDEVTFHLAMREDSFARPAHPTRVSAHVADLAASARVREDCEKAGPSLRLASLFATSATRHGSFAAASRSPSSSS